MPLPPFPPAETLALAGMGFLALFALWKGTLARRFARAERPTASG